MDKDNRMKLKTQDFLDSLYYKNFTLKLTKGRFRYLSQTQNKDLIKDFTMTLLFSIKQDKD